MAGSYPQGGSYFLGGEKLERRLREIADKLDSADTVRVGFLEGATYPDGTSVAMVAAIQEFGAPRAGIPARPFFRQMIAREAPTWGEALGRVLKGADYDANKALTRMGDAIGGELRQSIGDLREPALADKTVERKGFAKPLIDTGHMWNSINYEVVE